MSRLDPRLRLPQLAAFIAMVSVTIAQVTVGFFAIDRLGLDAAAGARMAGIALTAVGVGLILAQALVMKLEVHPRRWIVLGALISGIGFASVAGVQQGWQLPAAYALAAFGMGFVFPSFQALAADAVESHEQGAAAGTVAAAQGWAWWPGRCSARCCIAAGPACHICWSARCCCCCARWLQCIG